MAGTEPAKLSRSAGTMAFGGFLIVTAAFILVFARDIDAVDLGNHDPGPRAVPMTLGCVLLAGGFYQLRLGWFTRRRTSLDQPAGPDEEPADVPQPHNINVVITVVALIGLFGAPGRLGVLGRDDSFRFISDLAVRQPLVGQPSRGDLIDRVRAIVVRDRLQSPAAPRSMGPAVLINNSRSGISSERQQLRE